MDNTTAQKIRDLAKRFQSTGTHDRDNEAALRNDFLNPFWDALGWDLQNKAQLPTSLREVAVEPPVHSGGRKKRADYLFRINGIAKFVCEAKAAHVQLRAEDAFQAQRYAFNLGLNIAVLTNFRTTHIYAVGDKPDRRNPFAPVLSWHIDELIKNPDRVELLLRANVAQHSLDDFLQELPKKPTKDRGGWVPKLARERTVDRLFLEWLEQQRLSVSRALLSDNESLELGEELNLIATRILDRILFLRICEDRSISVGKSLREFLEQVPEHDGVRLYRELKAHFKRLRRTFNGVLFAEHAADKVEIRNTIIQNIIRQLIDDDSPYLFNMLPVEIIGSVYERFLGHEVVAKGKSVHLEPKPEARRAGGVYYTPELAARQIVHATLSKNIGSPTTRGTPARLGKIRVLDLACGSGAFLIQAFTYICDSYVAYYETFPGQLNGNGRRTPDGRIHLSTRLKRKIVKDCLFGVDIDPQAVEVTMMSLYLKILEGETSDTLKVDAQTDLFEPHLPDLGENIRRGNSVVASDFSEKELPQDVQDELAGRYPLDWEIAFPHIPEFDVVVGNPPYVRPHRISPAEKQYFWKTFDTFEKKSDLYVCFVERAIERIRVGGQFGFIVSRSWLTNDSFVAMRKNLLAELDVHSLLECPDALFPDASVRTIIITATRRSLPEDSKSGKANHKESRPPIQVGELTTSGEKIHGSIQPAHIHADPRLLFDLSLADPMVREIRKTMNARAHPLKNAFDVVFGLKTGDDKLFIHQEKRHAIDRPLVTGEDVQRWVINHRGLYVHYDPVAMRKHRATARPGESDRFEQPKLMIKDTTNQLAGALDENFFYAKDVLLVLPKEHSALGLDFLLGLINSRLMTFYFRSTFNTIHVQKSELELLPVVPTAGDEQLIARIAKLARRISVLMQSSTGTALEKAQADLEISVLELYALNERHKAAIDRWFSSQQKTSDSDE